MDEVLVDHPADGVARITLNRHQALNALSPEVQARLAECFEQLAAESSVRAIILTGGSEVFAAGADLKDMVQRGAIEMMLRRGERHWAAVGACPKPVIAAVNGYALGGGCELAMLADIIVAGEGAVFGQPEARVGIMPGSGGTQRLTRAVGKHKAMLMLLAGQTLKGREAHAAGLVSEVVPDDEVQSRALELAKRVALAPPLAMALIKEAVLAGQDASLEAALALERKSFLLLFASEDKTEGMNAFLEKRKPQFKGR